MGEAALEQSIEVALRLGRQLVAEALVEVGTVSFKGVCEKKLGLQSGLVAAGFGEHPRAAAEGLTDAHKRTFPFRSIRPAPLRRSRSLRVPRPSHSKNLLAAQDDKWGLTRAGLRGDATARLPASPQ